MIAVDLWQPQPGNEKDLGGQSYRDWKHDDNYENFSQHCTRNFPDRVEIIRECSWDAARHVADGALDFVFIDADHRYESVVKDIAAWRPKVRAGGILAGHDYNWSSVQFAVDETIGRVDVYPDNVWVSPI